MEYKQLGNTGLLVSRLCLGTMTFSDGGGIYAHIGNVGQAGADELVNAAINAGINFFDTADIYSDGQSEQTLGQSFRNLDLARGDVVLATKGYMRTGPGRNSIGASRKHIVEAVEASLKRLGTDYIDLYQIHQSDSITPIEETLRALDDLVRHGKVRYTGCSNWPVWKIATAFGASERLNLARFETVQAYYSLAGRDVEREMIPLLDHQRGGLLVWSPLAGGLLSGKYDRNNQTPQGARRSGFDFPIVDKERAWNIIDALRPVAQAHETSIARVALAWLLSRQAVTSVIVGAKRLDQLEDNLAAADLKLSDDDLAKLDAVSQLPPEYPGWMVDTQGADRLGPLDLWKNARTTASPQS
ncbi:aldo/keto reductase [Rhizobium sp. Root483D2]|uniref:aldo/keto reductase n=1 Tax=Rhizobium sp. Root483D2 TaxID=1736545 RepID=UPI0007155C1D|nr:aldo/keto reductase [Rhizobium sp. Root483D2]KQY42469.1 aldo/keto reductase [Rhizobium sp. Root483D2]